MGPEDIKGLSQKIFECAKKSTDEESLTKELSIVIDDFSHKFPELGRATALHEATAFLFNNGARHLSFFPSFALMTYQELTRIQNWYDASIIAGHMTEYQFELYANQQSNMKMNKDYYLSHKHKEDMKLWFNLWTESVKQWCGTRAPGFEQSWPSRGTEILNKCELFSLIPAIQEEVYDFWDLLIDTYGSFKPLEETLLGYWKELDYLSKKANREMDFYQDLKIFLSTRIRLLEKLMVKDLVDSMNRVIELAPKQISDEEIEVELGIINSNEDINIVCDFSNELASRLRVSGKIEDGIDVLQSVVARENFDIKYNNMAISSLKLAIYLDEVNRKIEAEALYKQVADIDPGTEINSVTPRTIHDACNRYSGFLIKSGRLAESKLYSMRENTLAELMGDPLLFVRSCFNVAADCNDLGEEREALEWFILGMRNLQDALGSDLGHPLKDYQTKLIEISRNLALAMGIEDRWGMMMNHMFADDESSNWN